MYNQNYNNYSGYKYRGSKERSGCLWILLVSYTLIYIMRFFHGCSMPNAEQLQAIQVFLPDVSSWYWYANSFSFFLGLICLAGLWMWQKWGWYEMLILNVVAVILSGLAGIPLIYSIIGGTVGLAIWWAVLSGHWDNFE